jgi:DNA-binding PadR family transcriptional regulator
MEKAGLIQGKWQRLPGGQERRYYYITQKGQKTLAERLTAWQDFATAVALIMQPATG